MKKLYSSLLMAITLLAVTEISLAKDKLSCSKACDTACTSIGEKIKGFEITGGELLDQRSSSGDRMCGCQAKNYPDTVKEIPVRNCTP